MLYENKVGSTERLGFYGTCPSENVQTVSLLAPSLINQRNISDSITTGIHTHGYRRSCCRPHHSHFQMPTRSSARCHDEASWAKPTVVYGTCMAELCHVGQSQFFRDSPPSYGHWINSTCKYPFLLLTRAPPVARATLRTLTLMPVE
jgi:hypothetical protein